MRPNRVFVGALLLAFVLGSCANRTEVNDLALAQKCLDQVPDSNPSGAGACLQYVQNYNDQQADILKCSIIMMWGGLTSALMVQAYNIFANSAQTNKAASFMTVLTLNNPDLNTGYARAQEADVFCQATGVLGLQYISSLIVSGTAMSVTMAALTIAPPNLSDPNSVNTAVQSLLSDCGGAIVNAGCAAQLPTIGATVVNLANSYCTQADADPTICGQVSSAVASAGSNSANVGQALLCYMNNKTFNPATPNQCN